MTPPAAPARARRTIVTPEGVPLNLPVADAGERIGAFIIDLLLLTFAILAVSLLANWLAPDTDEGTAIVDSIALLAAFVIRSFYFVAFELRRQGQTPGKRMMKIRVVDARGGPLTSDAIVARNLVRDVELFRPLSIVLVPDEVWPGAPGWAQAVAAGWALVVLFLPLFNRERARVGDLVAGTRVIAVPRTVLLPDLTTQRAQVAPADRPVFTPSSSTSTAPTSCRCWPTSSAARTSPASTPPSRPCTRASAPSCAGRDRHRATPPPGSRSCTRSCAPTSSAR
jgi:uncharacterized RDD family membrane protein YckC